MKGLILLLFLSSPALAQFSVGILGGVPFGNLTTGSTIQDKSSNYTIGPSFQLGLPLGFRLEADALYRPAGLSAGLQNLSAAQWRFPILAQFRFSTPILKPFVEAGYSYDHLNLSLPQYSVTSHHGFVLGAGVDFKLLLIRVSPEIRYTRDFNSGAANILQLNQAEFLVGIRF